MTGATPGPLMVSLSNHEGGGFLVDDQAVAALVLWSSGMFDTADIGRLLHVREDAVCRTLHMARDGAREVTR